MFEKFKEEVSASPAKYIAVFAILVVLSLICLYQVASYFPTIWPSEQAISKARKDLLDAQSALQAALNKRVVLQRHRQTVKKRSAEYWLISRQGNPSMKLKQIIDKAASASEFTLSSVGTIQTSKVAENISLVGLGVRGKAPMDTIVRFLFELEKANPAVYWKSLRLRQTSTVAPGDIDLRGYIQVEGISDPEVESFLSKTEH